MAAEGQEDLHQKRKRDEGEEGGSGKKKPRKSLDVLTFGLSHSPIQLELLSTQSVFQLVETMCNETTIGSHEGVFDHLWKVSVPGKGVYRSDWDESGGYDYVEGEDKKAKAKKLGDLGLALHSTMVLEYDYGSTSTYTITLLSAAVEEDYEGAFPRRKAIASVTPKEFKPDINLNKLFPKLNKTLFGKGVTLDEISLFQPGRKRHAGFVHRTFDDEYSALLYCPCFPSKKDLSNYLHTLDFGAGFDQEEVTMTWFSMVVLPADNCTQARRFSWDTGCECEIAPANSKPPLNKVFPKVAALAGFKKDPKVKKGWARYKDGVLFVCHGEAKKRTGTQPPSGTAFDGERQYEPNSKDDIVFMKEMKFESLHQLFCVLEGLLMTL